MAAQVKKAVSVREPGVMECACLGLNIPHKNVGAANCYPGLRRRLGGMGRWLRGGTVSPR
jgi:hypothetical protein